jgi:hypothetical protein
MDRKTVIPLFMIALLVLVASPVQAAEAVQVALTPDRSELTVGDPVRLTLEVTHPAGYQVIIPRLDQAWGDLEVRNQSPVTITSNGDSTETTRQVIEVTRFSLGDVETPPLALTISDGEGQAFEELTPSVTLSVVPTLPEEDNELRDIKPQAGLAVPAVWPWIAGGLLLATALAVAGWWAYRRWRGEPFLTPAVDNRPPWQVAYDELERIEALGLLEERRFKEYYTLVTDCLRAYLEAQFGLRAFSRTTPELRVVLRGSDLAPEQARRLLELFADSDLVKFAKLEPGVEIARRLAGEARQLVHLTSSQAVAGPTPEVDLVAFFGEHKPPATPVAASQSS